ncbi:MAG: hypothetical protein JTT11_10690 [Candidatus Brockarchaeota archaeon]|nr:hypothetical protein [Candidatus Brockarchaeota archaeon]
MNIRENLMAVLKRKEPEYVPFVPYREVARISPSAELKLRNMGMGIIRAWVPVYRVEYPNVRIEDEVRGCIVRRTYRTPSGSMSMKIRTGLKPEAGTNWIIEYPFKGEDDYRVLRFIEEDAVYRPDYGRFLEEDRKAGENGVASANAEPTPFSKLWVQYMGLERISKELYRHPGQLGDLINVMAGRQEEACRMIADSPAKLVWCGDQITSAVMNPKIFQRYYAPLLGRFSEILHGRDKIFSVHMDGLLSILKDEIKELSIDVVEAFTPPPMGDLSLKEARRAWGDKFVIWMNFPETLLHHGIKAIRNYTINLLKEAAPGDGLVVGMTEDAPPDPLEDALMTIAETMRKHGKYPIALV